MRRIFLHSLFWLAFSVYDILLTYTWINYNVSNVFARREFIMAVQTVLVLLPIDIALVYYFVLVAARRVLLSDAKSQWRIQLEILVVFSACVILYCLCFHYIINPFIYHVTGAANLFDARSILIAILELGYISGIAFAIKLYRLQLKAKEKEKNLVREKLETELKFLRNQTNPHFLFNTLNNIYALARKKSDQTAEVVMKLSELLSFMLYECGKQTIPVKQEIKIIEDYIDLQKIRFNNRLSIQMDKTIDDGAQHIAPLLMLPLVENAFKHGVSETSADSFIYTSVSLEKNVFKFCIKNNFQANKEKPEGGNIGLSNIRRQMELVYSDYSMQSEQIENLFRVDVRINLDSYGKA